MTEQPGDILIAGGKIYRVCHDCGEIVRINKPLFGSIHFCSTEEERRHYSREIARKAALNVAALMNAR